MDSYRDNGRRRPRGDTATHTVDQVHWLITRPTGLANRLDSVLGEIERRSWELLAKNAGARFVDKAGDSGEVVRLVEQLGEAITYYQVSENWFVASSTTHR